MRGDLYRRIRYSFEDRMDVTDPTNPILRLQKLRWNSFTALAMQVELRSEWIAQGLDGTAIPTKAELISIFNLSADEQLDLDDLMQLYRDARTLGNQDSWVTIWVRSGFLIESLTYYDGSIGEWQTLLQEAVSFNPDL